MVLPKWRRGKLCTRKVTFVLAEYTPWAQSAFPQILDMGDRRKWRGKEESGRRKEDSGEEMSNGKRRAKTVTSMAMPAL
jgi:hypothetical protein